MLEFALHIRHRTCDTTDCRRWVRKPQPPIERGSWLPQQHRETFLERVKRLARERREKAEQDALHDKQWRRDMREIELEKRRAKGRRQPTSEPIARSFYKGGYTRHDADPINKHDNRERFQSEHSTARIVGAACCAWLRSQGIDPAEDSWQHAQAAGLRQRDTEADE